MGRIRRSNTHLPARLVFDHGGYFYRYRENGKLLTMPLGRDERAAVETAEKLNLLHKKERVEAVGMVRSATDRVRDMIFDRDGFKCVYCGSKHELGIDHVIPYSQGGATKPFNLVTCCVDCNATKGDADPRDHILSMMGLRSLATALVLDLFSKKQHI